MTKAPEKSDGVWVRQQDTGAVRCVPAKEWKADEKALRKEGYVPCQEDGSPIEEATDGRDAS